LTKKALTNDSGNYPGIMMRHERKKGDLAPLNDYHEKEENQMRKAYCFPFMLLCVIGLIIGTQALGMAAEKTWTIKFHYEQPTTAPLPVYGFEPWAKAVEKATKGRVKVQIYPGDTLFKTKTDAVEAVKSGIADVAFLYAWAYSPQFDLTDVTSVPFIVPNAEVSGRVTWALFQKFPEMQDQWKDVKVLTIWTTDPYVFITTKKQIKIMEDFKGMKMRMTGGMAIDMMKLLGGVPITVPMPDCYENLQKGVIDGMAAPGEAIAGFRLYEVVKYYTMVPTTCVSQELIMNKKTWDGFPRDIQKAIMSVSGESGAIRFGGGCFDRAWTFLPEKVKSAGKEMITYVPPKEEVNGWVEKAGKPLWETWVKKMESGGYQNARKIQTEAIRLVKEYSAGKTDKWREMFP
jgi:TRAP-type C4-dicarboxylate transport system substrate-binding protein